MDLTDEDWRAIGKAGGIRVATLVRIEGARIGRDGVEREFVLEIADHGEDHGGSRYTAIATDERGRSAKGTPAATAGEALLSIRWHQLDDEPTR
jgi:hypothetical protein